MERNWEAMKRALLLVGLLRRGAVNKLQLMRQIESALPGSYGESGEKARGRTFERDLDNARYRLGADIVWDPAQRAYRLDALGPLLQADWPDDALVGLAFLKDTFTTSREVQEVIAPFLDWVEQLVPAEQMRRLAHHKAPIQLNVQRISEWDIHPDVWDKVIYAIKNRLIIEFDYVSPHHQADEPRRHRVEPYEHHFRNGHFYLRAYCLQWRAPNGYVGGQFWANPYRLNYIRPDELRILGSFVPRQQQAQQITIRYKLSPQIVRGGISRYFEEMEAAEPDEEGWVEVQARTDNEFEAYRILLAYGDQCVALAPETLRQRFSQVTQFFRQQYFEPANGKVPADKTEKLV